MVAAPIIKTCFKCSQTLPIGQFYKHAQMPDGHLNKCKECTKKYVRDHRMANIDKVRAYDRERSSLPHRRALRQRVVDKYEADFPERKKANTAVGNAIRDGRLVKGPCAFCGSTERVHAHHHDYAKPLDVTWLCPPCHRRFHALEQMATYDRAKLGGQG
jgi:hypothetical protein